MPDLGWQRLGRAVRAHRTPRWPIRGDFAAHCGLAERTIAAIENTERTNFATATIEAVELGLGWEFGSADLVRSGRQPRYLVDRDPDLVRIREAWPRLSAGTKRLLGDMAERATE